MTSIHSLDAAAPECAPRRHTFCFAAWHWHFYAGFFVMPFLRVLARPGGRRTRPGPDVDGQAIRCRVISHSPMARPRSPSRSIP